MGMFEDEHITKSEQYQIYENGYWQWYRTYECDYFEQEVQKLAAVSVPLASGWLKAVRQAQMISLKTMADRLKVSESSYLNLEKNELQKKISMARFIEAAEALDCEVVYFLRPKNNVRFSERVWHRLYELFANSPSVQEQPFERRHKTLVTFIKRQMAKVKFRKKMGMAANSDGVPRGYESQFV